MLAILCAHKTEAEIFIEYYGLVLKSNLPGLNLFAGNGIHLVLTGQGSENVEYALSRYFQGHEDVQINYWLNFGVAGSAQFEIGELVQIDRVTSIDLVGDKNPKSSALTLMVESGFPRTHCQSVSTMEQCFEHPGVFDMESAAITAELARRGQLDKLVMIKLISDRPDNKRSGLNQAYFKSIIAEKSNQLTALSDKLIQLQVNI